MASAQNYKNHMRFDPPYHFFALAILLLNVPVVIVWSWMHRAEHPYVGLWAIVVAIAMLLLALKTRMYALKVQDRVIRLEERQRLAALVTASELIELESLTTRQLIALRFASNAELPDLARRAVRERLSGKQIKQSVVSWREDTERV